MRRSARPGEAGEPDVGQKTVAAPGADVLSSGMLALEHAPAAIALATLAGDLLYLNPRAEHLFGVLCDADLAGHNLADICTETGQLATVEAVARDGRERQLSVCREAAASVPIRLLCKVTRVAGYGGIPTWLAFVGLERDTPATVDASLDELESLSILRRLTSMAAWKVRIEDWDNWTRNPMQWGTGLNPLLNLKPGAAKVTTPQGYLDFVAREDRESIRAALEKALLSGSRFESVHRISPRNGSPKTVLSRAVLVADDQASSAPALLGMVQDITSAVGSELRTYEKAAILETIATNTEAPVYAVDRDLRYTYFNSFFAMSMRYVYGTDTVLGERAYESISNDTRRRTVLGHLRRALGGTRVVEEIPICLDDAVVRHYELTYSPIKSGTGTSGVAVFGICCPSATAAK